MSGGGTVRRRPLGSAILVLLLLSLPTPGLAQTEPAGFNAALFGKIVGAALAFLAPRTLEPASPEQFVLWGLNGLTAIDPSLTVDVRAGLVRLVTPRGVLRAMVPPRARDGAAWTGVAVTLAQAGWGASAAIRDAGQQALIQSFFDELFNHLDPYSRYIAPGDASTDRDAREGGQASAGISVRSVGRRTLVSAVNANGPAWQAGIVTGQRLLAVDDHPTRNADHATIEGWLTGAEGSVVRLTLAQAHGAARTLRLIRARVPPETVFAFSSGDVVVLRISGFSTDTAQEVSEFLDQAMRAAAAGHPDPVRGLIFDLRGNRGGLLQQAVTSVALVLDHGVAVTTRGRAPQSNHVWGVQGGDLTGGLPVVVLVDGRTASAAEIMAAALADHRRAVVVGSATLGKGLVQVIAQLPDGGELFVTWSRVIAPDGWPLQGLGVMPQLCTSLGQAAIDHALDDLGAGVLDNARAVVESRRARAPLPIARILEIRSTCPAAIGGDGDLDAARVLIDDPERYHAALVPLEAAGPAPSPRAE